MPARFLKLSPQYFRAQRLFERGQGRFQTEPPSSVDERENMIGQVLHLPRLVLNNVPKRCKGSWQKY